MDAQFISIGLKKLIIPALANAVSKNFEPKDRIEVINERINRLDTFINRGQGNLSVSDRNTLNTHVSPLLPVEIPVATSCIACARSHIATVSASLKEAIRFSHDEGIIHPEVQTRLATAEEEITALERYDWSPERVLNSPPEHQEIVNHYLPVIRELRQNISTISTTEELVICAGAAGKLLSDYRMDVLKISIK
jgi:hypothetical protein